MATIRFILGGSVLETRNTQTEASNADTAAQYRRRQTVVIDGSTYTINDVRQQLDEDTIDVLLNDYGEG